MTAQSKPLSPRMSQAIEILDSLFTGRRDGWSTFDHVKFAEGVKDCSQVKSPLDGETWARHVGGVKPVGVHALVGDHLEWFSIDIDRDEEAGVAINIGMHVCQVGYQLGVPLHLELSKSKQAHVYGFFDGAVPAWKMRALARHILLEAGHPEKMGRKAAAGDEVVIRPMQDDANGKWGDTTFLPWFGAHARTGTQVFLDTTDGKPFADQVAAMAKAQRIQVAVVEAMAEQMKWMPPNVTRLGTRDARPGNAPAAAPLASVSVKAAPGAVAPLSDNEARDLCTKLPALRRMRETPAQCAHQDRLAGLIHLVPFANGFAVAEWLYKQDPARFEPVAFESSFRSAVAMYEKQNGARVSQLLVELWRSGGRDDIIPISNKYCIFNGRFAVRERKGDEELEPTPFTNFHAVITGAYYVDEGAEEQDKQQVFRVKGTLATGETLPESEVKSSEWQDVGTWLHKIWGFKPSISMARNASKMFLEALSQQSMDVSMQRIFRHTGWTSVAGENVFVLADGPVACSPEAAKAFTDCGATSVPRQLERYHVPATVTDAEAREGYTWVERLLMAGDPKATTPAIVAMFLAPLVTELPIDFGIWYCGTTGSKKSSYVAAAMTMYGAGFNKNTLPASFRDSSTGMEMVSYFAKDLPVCIDNYVPTERRDALQTVQRLAHTMGDRTTRQRATRDLRLQSSKPIRSFLICTGEDLPAGHSTTARFYMVNLNYRSLMPYELEQVQTAGREGRLAWAGSHYLTWLAGKKKDPAFISRVMERWHEAVSRYRGAPNAHGRLAEQSAWMEIGFALASASHPAGAWNFADMPKYVENAMIDAMALRNATVRDASLTTRFLKAVQYLVSIGKLVGGDIRGNGAPTVHPDQFGYRVSPSGAASQMSEHAQRAIWVEESVKPGGPWFVYLSGDHILTTIKEAMRTSTPIAESDSAVREALKNDGVLCEGGHTDRASARISTPNGRIRAWKLHGPSVLRYWGMEADEQPVLEEI